MEAGWASVGGLWLTHNAAAQLLELHTGVDDNEASLASGSDNLQPDYR